MATTILASASCEVRGMIRFLLAKELSAATIHLELCRIYGSDIMNDKQAMNQCLSETRGHYTLNVGVLVDIVPVAQTTGFKGQEGEVTTSWMAGLGLIAINEGTQPTFVRGQSTSILDIALATERIAGCIATFSLLWWPMVLDGWCLKKLDLGGFKSEMHNQILSRNVKTANDLRRVLTIACNASMPRKTEKRNRGPVYWWTHEIACLRQDCLHKAAVIPQTCPSVDGGVHVQPLTKDVQGILTLNPPSEECSMKTGGRSNYELDGRTRLIAINEGNTANLRERSIYLYIGHRTGHRTYCW
nr:unnamed protein product [Callosobruchus analis]